MDISLLILFIFFRRFQFLLERNVTQCAEEEFLCVPSPSRFWARSTYFEWTAYTFPQYVPALLCFKPAMCCHKLLDHPHVSPTFSDRPDYGHPQCLVWGLVLLHVYQPRTCILTTGVEIGNSEEWANKNKKATKPTCWYFKIFIYPYVSHFLSRNSSLSKSMIFTLLRQGGDITDDV